MFSYNKFSYVCSTIPPPKKMGKMLFKIWGNGEYTKEGLTMIDLVLSA